MNEMIAAAALLYREAKAKYTRLSKQASEARAEYEHLDSEACAAGQAAREAERALLAIARGER